MFAKLYEPEPGRQVLVKLDAGENCEPEVRIYCEPRDGGISSVMFGWEDNSEGWDKAYDYFNTMDEAEAVRLATKFIGF